MCSGNHQVSVAHNGGSTTVMRSRCSTPTTTNDDNLRSGYSSPTRPGMGILTDRWMDSTYTAYCTRRRSTSSFIFSNENTTHTTHTSNNPSVGIFIACCQDCLRDSSTGFVSTTVVVRVKDYSLYGDGVGQVTGFSIMGYGKVGIFSSNCLVRCVLYFCIIANATATCPLLSGVIPFDGWAICITYRRTPPR